MGRSNVVKGLLEVVNYDENWLDRIMFDIRIKESKIFLSSDEY